jgi:hypothetical protein
MKLTEEKPTNFELWTHDSLVWFAQEANEKIKQQQAEIDALRADLKTVLKAWRDQMS